MNHILRDTGLVYRRYLGMLLRNPVWIAIGVIQPVVYLDRKSTRQNSSH